MPLPSPRNPILPARGNYADLLANVASLQTGELCWASDQNQFYLKEGGTLVSADDTLPGSLVIVGQKADLPMPIGGVITLGDNITYFITATIDLLGDRIVAGRNTTIIGGSSENCRLKSTGLAGAALISSQWSLPIRHITIEASIAINLDATGNSNQALDWFGVNFADCATIGLVKNYGNFIFNDGSFLNSAGLTLDGTIGTVSFGTCLFSTPSGTDAFILASTLVITRRFRTTFSSFVVSGAGKAAIRVDTGAIIPSEGLILIECNFTLLSSSVGVSGLGTIASSNIVLVKGCRGLENTAVNGQMYMADNATQTTFTALNTFTKIAGVTVASADNAKYLHSNNRLTCDAARQRKYLIQFTLSFVGTNGNQYEFGFYDSKLGGVRVPSRTTTTAGSGRVENVKAMCIVSHVQGDYLEIWAQNKSAANACTVQDMNVTVTELGG